MTFDQQVHTKNIECAYTSIKNYFLVEYKVKDQLFVFKIF